MSLFEGLANSVGLGAQGASNNMYGNAQNMNATQYNQMVNQQIAAKQSAYNAAQQRRIQGGAVPGGRPVPITPFNPNEIEAYQIPLSQLVTLWQAKYGDKWVELREVSDTEFFGHAADRLVRNNLMEECRNWMRIKEGV